MAEIKTTDLYCLDCKYYSHKDTSCDYYLRTKVRRGCPAGTGCTRHEEGKLNIRVDPAPQLHVSNKTASQICKLYAEGYTDMQIAKRMGMSVDTVFNWRKRLRLSSQKTLRKESESSWI